MKNRHGKWVKLPLPSTKKASPSVSSRDREDTREVEQSSDVASLREAVSSLQRARVALGQEKADAEARAAAAELQVEELVAKDTREVEQSSDVASLREAVASLQRARVALGQEKADAEARAAAAERQVEELVAKMEMETGRADAAEARGRQLEAQVAEQRAGAHWSVDVLKQNIETIEMETGRADAAEARGRELEAAIYNYVQRQH